MEQLLTTKFYIPITRPELVHRPRLIKLLNAGTRSGRKMTLISAPAGFGKTTLVSQWANNLRLDDEKDIQTVYRIVWVSLDEGDNDPVRFLTYLIAAINRVDGVDATLGESALGMLESSQPTPPEEILTSLINESAAISDRIIVVLDDYHVIESPQIDEVLAFLLEHLPPQLHLVIATREDPYLPLARLRARGQLTELRAVNLRFTYSEAAEFLGQVMGLNLSAEDIAALETRTEGWIAGLQLAAISMQGSKDGTSFIKSLTGSHRYVLDYLIEEVLEQQSERVLTFLLQTAILDRLTGSLCDALTGQDDGQATLERLEHDNLFIVPLDEERCWYRYHHLFVDLLRKRLHQTQPEQLPTLHLRAFEWYEENGFVDDSIEHSLRAEDFERAAQQIERVAEVVWASGVDTKLRRWLDRLPVELVFSKPQLCIFNAWYLIASGKQDAAERFLQSADLALEPPDYATETVPLERDQLHRLNNLKLRGRLAATQAFLAFYRGDVTGIVQHASRALEYLPGQDSSWRNAATHILGDGYDFSGEMVEAYRSRLEAVEASRASGNSTAMMIANLKLAVILRQRGQLQRVIDICTGQMQFAVDSGMAGTVMAGWLLAIWGEALAEINDLEGAIQNAKKGVEITDGGGDLAMLGSSYLFLIRVLFSTGDLTSAEKIVHKIENTAQGSDVPPWIMNQKAAWQARIWLAQGKPETASQWVLERGLDANRELAYLHEMENIVLARILIAQRQLDDATGLLQRLLEAAEAGGRTTRMIEILNLQALSFQSQGDTDRAINTLERALSLAEPGGFIRIFVDEGLPMARLLHVILSRAEALSRGIAPDYVRQLLGAFPIAEQDHVVSSQRQSPESELIEPLSEREIEVLQLVAEGLTNPQIAARLYLSLNTVKVHTRNIYGKLGVGNRTGAVARARALGILLSS